MKNFFILIILASLILIGCTSQIIDVNLNNNQEPTNQGESGLANPASVSCKDRGGTLKIREEENGGQYGVCLFDDGSECEEWAYFRGECQPGENISEMTIQVYFSNNRINSRALDCSLVYPLERKVRETRAVARAALEKLLEGPIESEKEEEYFTNINPGVTIQSLTIEDGIAKVDFSEELEQGIGGSCKVIAIRAQIEETLKQFPTVNSVIISINGRTEDILQP